MMDYTTQQSPEHGLVQRLVRASTQLQREEGFLTIEEQDLARSLGINWFQATTFRQAQKSLDTFLKDNKSEPTKELALVNGLKALLSELLPTLFAIRFSDENEDYMPDENSLLMRLRHHFMLKVIYQDHFLQPKTSSSTQGLGGLAQPAKNAFGIDIWLANLDSAIRFVHDELGLNRGYAENVIAGNLNPLLADPKLSQGEKSLLIKFISAIEDTRKELKDDYQRKSSHVRPSQLAALIPTMISISHLIRSYIQRAYLMEEEKAAAPVFTRCIPTVSDEPREQEKNVEPSEQQDIARMLQEFIKNSGGK